MKSINVKNISFSNSSPISIIAGLNVLEDEDMALNVAKKLKDVTKKNSNKMQIVNLQIFLLTKLNVIDFKTLLVILKLYI